jgi:hypothetical protein
MSKDRHLIVRSDAALRERLQAIAAEKRRVLSDLLRIVLEDYASEEERRLGKPDAGTSVLPFPRTGTDSLNDAAAVVRSPFPVPRSSKPRKP